MSFQPNGHSRDLSKNTTYLLIMLLAAVVAAIAQVYGLIPSIKPPATTDDSVMQPHPVPTPVVRPTPVPTPKRLNVCGVWRSETSGKEYDFICKGGGNSFEIYERAEQGWIRRGSGTMTGDDLVDADMLSLAKNRTGHLKLRISPDGKRMEGPWLGDDPRESGTLMFNRV